MAIDAFVERFYCAFLKALSACRSLATDTAGIEDQILLKKRLPRQWQVTREPDLKADVILLQTTVKSRLKEWRNDL
jgi:hypothetical protein